MNEDRVLALALRQQQLLARSAEIRRRVAVDMAPWKQRLHTVDKWRWAVGSGWHWLRRHPEVPAGLAVGVALLRPRRVLGWAWRWGRRAWLGWQLYRRVLSDAGASAPPAQSAASRGASLARMVVELTRR